MRNMIANLFQTQNYYFHVAIYHDTDQAKIDLLVQAKLLRTNFYDIYEKQTVYWLSLHIHRMVYIFLRCLDISQIFRYFLPYRNVMLVIGIIVTTTIWTNLIRNGSRSMRSLPTRIDRNLINICKNKMHCISILSVKMVKTNSKKTIIFSL